jgi:excisionase family DNA binding protein
MNTPTSEGRGSFTVEEMAARHRVSRVTIYRALKSGALQAVRIGGSGERRGLRITPAAEAAWIADNVYNPDTDRRPMHPRGAA